jgi:hypothetical protein
MPARNLNVILLLFVILVIFPPETGCSDSGQNTATNATIFPDLTGQDLLDNLIATYKPSTVLSYDVARDVMYGEIDNFNDSLSCVYTGFTIYLDPNADPSTDAYLKHINAEHSWPQSKGAVNNAKSDMHHLYPAKDNVNSSRGNNPYDDIDDAQTDNWYRKDVALNSIPSTVIDQYSEKDNDTPRFEPREDHKGNAARAMFYFYTMYKSEADAADPAFFGIQKDVLRRWNAQDPPDAAEFARNTAVAGYQQGKENPFILDTTLVQRAYFPESIGGIAAPSGFAATTTTESQNDLGWALNVNSDPVLLVFNTSGSFTSPSAGTTYSTGQNALGGTVLYTGPNPSFTHTGLSSGTTYYYRLYSVNGSAGNELYSWGAAASALWQTGGVSTGTVVITEFMPNPNAILDSNGEWFEVYNPGTSAVDINGWTISDLGTDSHTISNGGPLLVPADDYIVLGIDSNPATNGGVTVDYQYSGITLGNSGDEIILTDGNGTEIDRVAYDDGTLWPFDTGISAELDDSSYDNNDYGNWRSAGSNIGLGDLGTPGGVNSAEGGSATISSLNSPATFGIEPGGAAAVTLTCVSGTTTGATSVAVRRGRQYDDAFNSLNRYVVISTAQQPDNATLVLAYDEAELNGLNENELWLYGWYDDAWHAAGTSIVDAVNNTVTATGISHFSVWTAGSSNDISLAVELSGFSGQHLGNEVQLEWRTESEIENAGFILERAAAGSEDFQVIADYRHLNELGGQGNSSQATDYRFSDRNILRQNGYRYLLRSESVSGIQTAHPVIEVSPVTNLSSAGFTLYANYPDPFNPSTRFEFDLAVATPVRVAVYDSRGRMVNQLLSGPLAAGRHTVKWDGNTANGSAAASGIYFIRLFAGNRRFTEKALLLR